MSICSASWRIASHNSQDEKMPYWSLNFAQKMFSRNFAKIISQFLRKGNLFRNTSYMKIRRASCSFDSYSFHVNWLRVKALIRLKTKFAAAEKTIERFSDNQNLHHGQLRPSGVLFPKKENAPINALRDITLRKKTAERDVTLSDEKIKFSEFIQNSVRIVSKGFAPLTLRTLKNF